MQKDIEENRNVNPFDELIDVVARLRAPDGCPWDREQTHASLKPACIEEASEVVCGINYLEESGDPDNLKEELGDLLLQVVMHSQIAKEEGLFTIDDVIRGITDKMIKRHPHVFGRVTVSDTGEVLKNWEDIKKKEKEGKEDISGYLREAFLESQNLIDKAMERKGLAQGKLPIPDKSNDDNGEEPDDCGMQVGDHWFRYRTGAIIIRNHKMLFVRSKLGDYFYMIGGGVHLGENSETCIEREVFEETGVKCKALRSAIICENFFTGKDGAIDGKECHVLEYYYLMEIPENAVFKTLTDENEELVWVPMDEFFRNDIRPAFLKERLKEVIEGGSLIHVINNEIVNVRNSGLDM